jgi:uncharacterized membrane protein YhhN
MKAMAATISIDNSDRLPLRFKLLLALAGLAGLGYLLLGQSVAGPAHVLLKGSSVFLLAFAAAQVRGGNWLAIIMALGACGDMLLEMPGLFMVGATSFALGHGAAIGFYWQHRRQAGGPDRGIAAAMLAYGLAMPLLLVPAGQSVWPALVYAMLLCTMAASLWQSRFPRLAAIGAIGFIASDTLLVMRLGGRELFGPATDGALVWSLYCGGQWLITLGVARGLLARAAHRD